MKNPLNNISLITFCILALGLMYSPLCNGSPLTEVEKPQPQWVAQWEAYSLKAEKQLKAKKYKQALRETQKALDLVEISGRDTHIAMVSSLDRLAYIYASLANYPQAELLYKKAIKLSKKNLGPDSVDTAALWNNLAHVYYFNEQYNRAEDLYRLSLENAEKSLKPFDPELVKALKNLAGINVELGNLTEAEWLFQRALRIQEKVLGPKHRKVAYFLFDLANVYFIQGRKIEGEALFDQAIAIWESSSPSSRREQTINQNELQKLKRRHKPYAVTERALNATIHKLEKEKRENSPHMKAMLKQLIEIYRKTNRMNKVEAVKNRLKQIKTKQKTD